MTRRRPLGELAEVQYGWTAKASVDADGPRMLRITDIQEGRVKWDDVPRCEVPDEKLDTFLLHAGDIVFARIGATTGKSFLIDDNAPSDAVFASYLIRVRPHEELRSDFLAYFFQSAEYWAHIHRESRGIGRPAVNGKLLSRLPVPVPDEDVQERVVAELRHRLAQVQDGREAFERALAGVAQYRAAAVRDAMDSDWPRRPLKDVLHTLRNGIFVSRPGASPPGIPIYRISAVRPLALNTEDIRYAPDDLPKHEDYLVAPDDLLFTRYSGNAELVGACARVPAGATPALHPDKLIRGVVDRTLAEPAFLELACSSGATWQEIRAARKTTAGQVGISGSQLKAVSVPVPSLDEQRRVVEECSQQLAAADALERRLKRSLEEADRVRQAVLYDAFTDDEITREIGPPVLAGE